MVAPDQAIQPCSREVPGLLNGKGRLSTRTLLISSPMGFSGQISKPQPIATTIIVKSIFVGTYCLQDRRSQHCSHHIWVCRRQDEPWGTSMGSWAPEGVTTASKETAPLQPPFLPGIPTTTPHICTLPWREDNHRRQMKRKSDPKAAAP